MKILRVTSSLYPYKTGGIGLHAHEMSKEQVRRGHDVVVYTTKIGSGPKREYKEGYIIVHFKPIIKLMNNSFVPVMLPSLIHNMNKFDIIHAHSFLFFSTNLCAMAKKLGSPPLIITNHGLISQTVPLWMHKVYVPTIGKWTLNSADKMICYTDTEKRKLENLGVAPSKIAVIHNGIDVNRFVPKEKENSDDIRILWIGRVVPGKGVEYLIDAIKLLLHKITNLKLIMIGEGPSKEKIKRKISGLGLDEYIFFKDFIPNSELQGVYQNSDVFVLPSINEGIPRTILEAMSCGLPVVCTKLPQLTDVIKGSGLLVPVRDSQALTDAIFRIISAKELARKLGENGRKKVVENYSWEDTVNKTINLYEEIICQK
ncbi:glycosyltransferase family 4 protein [candidate division WOR-3 bacterium]|nr:glycosyltransferase family 4 protein [candidate division WOR-3 bacterium]